MYISSLSVSCKSSLLLLLLPLLPLQRIVLWDSHGRHIFPGCLALLLLLDGVWMGLRMLALALCYEGMDGVQDVPPVLLPVRILLARQRDLALLRVVPAAG